MALSRTLRCLTSSLTSGELATNQLCRTLCSSGCKSPEKSADVEYYNQLWEDVKHRAEAAVLPANIDPEAVFANNEMDLAQVDVYGFDYDYTLAGYSDSLQYNIFEMGKQALLKTKNYPKALERLEYIPEFAIRGLHFDLKKGLMMKLDSFHHIQKDTVYRGLTRVPWEEVIAAYSGSHVPVNQMNQFHGSGTEMHQFVDIFAIPEISLIAQVIEFFRSNCIEYDPEYVFWDVRSSVQSIHSSGELHAAITHKLPEYLTAGKEISQLLERLVSHNKKLFLISNSGYKFIDAGMRHMVGQNWVDLFDVVIINARKPDFFTSQKRPFRMYNHDTNSTLYHRVTSLDKGSVYSEGNLFDLRTFTGWSGSRVLYFGDHVYTDLADATLHHGWKTGAIIPELKQEIITLNDESLKKDVMLMVGLQDLIEKHQSAAPDEVLHEWLTQLTSIKKRTKTMFNPQFGSLFRTYHNPTYFSRRLHRFADIYTASLTNLLHYSPRHTFYPRRGALAHENLYSL